MACRPQFGAELLCCRALRQGPGAHPPERTPGAAALGHQSVKTLLLELLHQTIRVLVLGKNAKLHHPPGGGGLGSLCGRRRGPPWGRRLRLCRGHVRRVFLRRRSCRRASGPLSRLQATTRRLPFLNLRSGARRGVRRRPSGCRRLRCGGWRRLDDRRRLRGATGLRQRRARTRVGARRMRLVGEIDGVGA